ncbi:MAG: flavodoxin family protein [Candidatus Thorarchaeota archaeon]|jgi:flavorubredoxin
MKRALIVYESKFRNTEKVAREIAAGIEESGDISTEVRKPQEVNLDQLHEYDAILFGCPVHVMNATRGIRNFIGKVGKKKPGQKLTSTFETYMGTHLGKATSKMESIIRKKIPDFTLAIESLSVEVTGYEGPLAEDGLPRALEFGLKIGQMLLD